jgi:hypothetical protein
VSNGVLLSVDSTNNNKTNVWWFIGSKLFLDVAAIKQNMLIRVDSILGEGVANSTHSL